MVSGKQDARPTWRPGARCRLALRCGGLVVGLGAVVLTMPRADALTINPTFDATITGSDNAATIETAINNAVSFYSAFNDPVAVSIDFQVYSTTNYVGRNLPTWGYASYSDYTAALYSDAVAANNNHELTGYNNLGAGNTGTQIRSTSANLRALGFNVSGTRAANGTLTGSFDGIVYLSSYWIAGFGGTGTYTAISTIQHEVNEVLGIGGDGSVLNTTDSAGTIGPIDLFRYSAPATPSLSTSATESYFSLDGGTTSLVEFSQSSGADYADWGTYACTVSPCPQYAPPYVQQAVGTPASPVYLDVGSPEVVALQAIGYDLPEPGAAAGLATSLLGLAIVRRRRSA